MSSLLELLGREYYPHDDRSIRVCIFQFVINDFKRQHKDVDITGMCRPLRRLMTQCQRGTQPLKQMCETEVYSAIDNIVNGIDYA